MSSTVGGVTVGLTTIAVIYVLVCLLWKPPDSRLGLLLFGIAAASLGVFGTLASGVATGIDTFDDVVRSVPVGMR